MWPFRKKFTVTGVLVSAPTTGFGIQLKDGTILIAAISRSDRTHYGKPIRATCKPGPYWCDIEVCEMEEAEPARTSRAKTFPSGPA